MFDNKILGINIGLFAFATILSYFMFAGLPIFLGDATYIDFNVTNSILSGNGISTGPNIHGEFTPFGKRPPGFSLVLALLALIGFSVSTASIITTTISYALLPVFVFLIFRYYFDNTKSLIAAIIVMLHPSLIYYSKIAAPEIIGVLILTMTYYFYLKWLNNEENNQDNYSTIILLGLVLGLTIWFRYANGIYILVFSSLIIFYSYIHKSSRIRSLAILLIGGLISTALLLRNYVQTGNLSGHPINNVKTNDMDVAIVKSLNYLTNNNIKFDVNNESVAIAFIVTLLLMSLYIIFKTFENKINLLKILPIALLPLSYLLFFSYVQSTTRVDDVSSRYLLPFYLSIVIQIIFIVYSFDYKQKFKPLLKIIFIICVINYSYASYKIGSVKRVYNDRDYSPQTLAYITNNIEKGSVIIGSRYLGQILMSSLDYSLMGLRFYSSYNKAYSRKLSYNKEELLERIIKHNVQHLIIFTGSDKKENFLSRDDYGEFITNLVKSKTDIVDKKIELSDGIVIIFKDKEEIKKIYSNFKNKISLLSDNRFDNNLKITSRLGKVLYNKNKVLHEQKQVENSSDILFKFSGINSLYMTTIDYSLPKEKLKMIGITLRNENDFAHYFFNPSEIKFDTLSLRSDNIDRKSEKFSMNNIDSMTIRLYPSDKADGISDFQINAINFYTKQ
jgi:hypothetical protein